MHTRKYAEFEDDIKTIGYVFQQCQQDIQHIWRQHVTPAISAHIDRRGLMTWKSLQYNYIWSVFLSLRIAI